MATIAATPYTTDGFGKWNGTSLSCPLVAGVVALVIQAHPDWGPELVKEAIRETGSHANRPDIRFGWGIVNARDAINYPSFSGYLVDSETGLSLSLELQMVSADQEHAYIIKADSSGYFLFANLPEAMFRLTVDNPGFEKYETDLSFPPSEEFDIYLKRK